MRVIVRNINRLDLPTSILILKPGLKPTLQFFCLLAQEDEKLTIEYI